jgi:hypothetical protein
MTTHALMTVNDINELRARSEVLDLLSEKVIAALEMFKYYEPLLLPEEKTILIELEAINGAA